MVRSGLDVWDNDDLTVLDAFANEKVAPVYVLHATVMLRDGYERRRLPLCCHSLLGLGQGSERQAR